MHHIMNNKTGAFVSALLHTVKYGKPCRFVTDGNVVLRNMRNTYGIDMDDFSVLDAGPRHSETKCPATDDVTGGLMQRASIINRCHTSDTFAQSFGAIDAPEWLPTGATCQWGPIVVLRED